MRLTLLGFFIGLLSYVSALSLTGSKLLVVGDSEEEQAKYSKLWEDLIGRGFDINYRSPTDTSLSLFAHDEPAWSHLLLLPIKGKTYGNALTSKAILEFVNKGSNVMVALSSSSAGSYSLNSLLLELDIAITPTKNSLVVDHFNYDQKSAGDKHDVLVVSGPNLTAKPIRDYLSVPGVVAMPRSIAQTLGNESPLLAPVIKAPETAYIQDPSMDGDDDDLFATGSQISLVTAFQALNNARVTVIGSAEALQDEWFDANVERPGTAGGEATSNRDFATKLTAWTFKETGVLKVQSVQHYSKEDPKSSNPSIYRIKEEAFYSIELSEWVINQWQSFVPAQGDTVQLEVSMLSPFHRLNLAPTAQSESTTTFSADFKLPDQHGIFNFYVDYRRPFLTGIEEKETVTVRHMAHDEWPRSFVITGAYPWVAGVWVTIAGWLAFVALWLYSKPVQQTKLESKKL